MDTEKPIEKISFVGLDNCVIQLPWEELPMWAEPVCLDCGKKPVYVEMLPGAYETVCACTYH